MPPGAPVGDAPITVNGADGWLLAHCAGAFTLVCFDTEMALPKTPVPLHVLRVDPPHSGAQPGATNARAIVDIDGLVAKRFDAQPGTVYLLRPDQHVAARWRRFDADAITAALDRALGKAGAAS